MLSPVLGMTAALAADDLTRSIAFPDDHRPDADLKTLGPAVLEAYQARLDAKVARTQNALRRNNREWEVTRSDLEAWVDESEHAQHGAIESVVSLALGTLAGNEADAAERDHLLSGAYMDRFQASLVRADRRLDEAATQGVVPQEVFARFDDELRQSQQHVRRAIGFVEDAARHDEMEAGLEKLHGAVELEGAIEERSAKHRLLGVAKAATDEVAVVLNESGSVGTAGLLYVRLASFGTEYAYSAARFWVAWRETDRLLALIEGGAGKNGPAISLNDRVRRLDEVLKAAVREREAVKQALPCARAKERLATLDAALPAIRAAFADAEARIVGDPSCAACQGQLETVRSRVAQLEKMHVEQQSLVSDVCRS